MALRLLGIPAHLRATRLVPPGHLGVIPFPRQVFPAPAGHGCHGQPHCFSRTIASIQSSSCAQFPAGRWPSYRYRPRLSTCWIATRHSFSTVSPRFVGQGKSKDDSSLPTRENIYTIPNLLTFTRIALCPVLAYTILQDQYLVASGVMFYCGLSDLVDGKLARMYPEKMASVLGTILDPAADKILMTTLVLSLSWKGLLPLPLAVIIIGRDVLLSMSAFYFRYQSLPVPKTLRRFWDISLPSAEVKPTQISKYNTFLQLILVGLTTVNPILPMDISTPLLLLQWTVGATTLGSGLSYVFSKDAIRYIK